MAGNKKNNDHEPDLRKKLEEIEHMINSLHITEERYSGLSDKRSAHKNSVEIYR